MKNIILALLAAAAADLLIATTDEAQPGSVDLAFNAGASVDFTVVPVALQSNGKVIIGGGFGTPTPGLARLNPPLAVCSP